MSTAANVTRHQVTRAPPGQAKSINKLHENVACSSSAATFTRRRALALRLQSRRAHIGGSGAEGLLVRDASLGLGMSSRESTSRIEMSCLEISLCGSGT